MNPFRYDPTRLFATYSPFHERLGWHHPNPPAVIALGYPDVFMGWRRVDAEQACVAANSALDKEN
jgi:hypothetical protein